MHIKQYRMRSLAVENGKTRMIDLDLEFEGRRAFVIWDSITFGDYRLKARVEIDPGLLRAEPDRECDFFYHGSVVLPRAENN